MQMHVLSACLWRMLLGLVVGRKRQAVALRAAEFTRFLPTQLLIQAQLQRTTIYCFPVSYAGYSLLVSINRGLWLVADVAFSFKKDLMLSKTTDFNNKTNYVLTELWPVNCVYGHVQTVPEIRDEDTKPHHCPLSERKAQVTSLCKESTENSLGQFGSQLSCRDPGHFPAADLHELFFLFVWERTSRESKPKLPG